MLKVLKQTMNASAYKEWTKHIKYLQTGSKINSLVSALVFEGIFGANCDLSCLLLRLLSLQASVATANRLQNVTDGHLLV